jgi:hypothetical protein
MKRQELLNKLDQKLQETYRNGRLMGKLKAADYEKNLHECVINLQLSLALMWIEDECPALQKFGPMEQVGPDEDTITWAKFIDQDKDGVNFVFRSAKDIFKDCTLAELKEILEQLTHFNSEVRRWCEHMPDVLLEGIRQEYKDTLEKNKITQK